MAQSSLGVTKETSMTEKRRRAIMKDETRLFQQELYRNLALILDSLEGTEQRVFWQFETNLATKTISIKFGSTISLSELPSEVLEQVIASEKELRSKEDSDPKHEITITYEGTIPDKSKVKPLSERLEEIRKLHEPKEEKKESP